MGDDANSRAFIREQSKVFSRAGNHWRGLEQVSLSNRKAVQAQVLLFRLYPPFAETIGDLCRQITDLTFKPFSRDLAHPRVKVAADAVEIDTDDFAFNAHGCNRSE